MERKIMQWKVKGMNRDTSVSAFSSEFAFENHNLRLSTNENNTTLSWVNEKGTLQLECSGIVYTHDHEVGEYDTFYSIEGYPVGTAVLNNYLVLFTTTNTDSEGSGVDRIYRLEYTDDDKTIIGGVLLYIGNINLCTSSPLETFTSYETEIVQKVYWTDGRNQPRVINITSDAEHLAKWEKSDYTAESYEEEHFFDFVPTVDFGETVSVVKNTASGGTFAPGVIQYCFAYYNKYGQQSNLVYMSPLYYLAHQDRGAAADEKVSCSFVITIKNPDENFDYIRLYSVQRTSLNLDPYARLVDDILISGADEVNGVKQIIYTDNGTTGSSIDPTELLFIGGKEITALTMAEKDNTLFMGNLSEDDTSVNDIQEFFDSVRDYPSIEFKANKPLLLDHTTGIYSHTNTLNHNQKEITTFKGGETYRFGFQLQKPTGEWTQPIFIEDATNTVYPSTSIKSDNVNLVTAQMKLQLLDGTADYTPYVKARPVIVYPNINDRTVLCQGVLNPTVFNVEDRKDGYPYAQASWYFRPFHYGDVVATGIVDSDIDITVTNPSTSDYAYDSNFEGSGETAYVLVATVSDSLIYNLLSKGSFTVSTTTWKDYFTNGYEMNVTEHFFYGAIKLTQNSDSNTYAFISKTAWEIPGTVKIDNNSYYRATVYVDDVNYHKVSDIKIATETDGNGVVTAKEFTIYNSLKNINSFLYYYNSDSEAQSSYVFKFTDGTTNYNVTFNNQSTGSSSTGNDYFYDNSGSHLRYIHYDSLYSTEDATGGNVIDRTNAKFIEIQGAVKSYNDVFASTPIDDVNSNTQFFVDQSIVTLNSPDLEFDTEVQTYGTGGLKMRIVGAIPITASVSAHSINTSTNMLEQNYTTDSSSSSYENSIFGTGERDINVKHENISLFGGRRLVAEYLWNDTFVKVSNDEVQTLSRCFNYLVYPWQREGSLNNDSRKKNEASSTLDTKKESNLLFSINTEYLSSDVIFSESHPETKLDNIEAAVTLTENQEVMNYRLKKQKQTSSEINYYPNIDKVLYNEEGYEVVTSEALTSTDSTYSDYITTNSPVYMRYKSTSHFAIALDAEDSGLNSKIPILPCPVIGSLHYGAWEKDQAYANTYTTFWGDTNIDFSQNEIDISGLFNKEMFNFLWLAELYKEPVNRFGGTSKTALLNNTWLVAGDAINLKDEEGDQYNTVYLKWTIGDTYYQRYDCLKTYAYSTDDTNQLVEILSFMCESHVNIDGRYDKNRGQTKNYNMHPINFNLHNPVYSQQDNFIVGKKLNIESADELKYPNQIYYTKTKTLGADIDLYTNTTLASTLDLDGDKGRITSLRRLNNDIIAFQDSGIAQVLYNENVQISATNGVPIEIANSGKVQGKRYISDMVGCSNKWSVVNSPQGIYFMDSRNKSIYLFNGQLSNLSISLGFNTWTHSNIPSSSVEWTPDGFDNFVSYYDKLNQEILFINEDECLAYSEKIGNFTSFYDYNNVPYFCNLDDTGLWITKSGLIYRHQMGTYCEFFGESKPYYTTMIANADGTTDKLFTNLEFAASVDGDGTEANEHTFNFLLPFNHVECWNDYQHGMLDLQQRNGVADMRHFNPSMDTIASLKRKFRLWRCDVPRDNASLSSDAGMNIARSAPHPLNRMRNPWLYFKLYKDAEYTQNRAEIHNILMTYFV